ARSIERVLRAEGVPGDGVRVRRVHGVEAGELLFRRGLHGTDARPRAAPTEAIDRLLDRPPRAPPARRARLTREERGEREESEDGAAQHPRFLPPSGPRT